MVDNLAENFDECLLTRISKYWLCTTGSAKNNSLRMSAMLKVMGTSSYLLFRGCLSIASFPGLSRLQFLIACSMQILELEKAWERG